MGLESLTMSTGTPESLVATPTDSSVRPITTAQESPQVSDFQIALQLQQNALHQTVTETSQNATEGDLIAPEAKKVEQNQTSDEENALLNPNLLLNFMIPAPALLPVAVAPTAKDETAANFETATSAPMETTLAPAPQTRSGSLPVLSGLEMASTQELPQEIQAAIDALSKAVAPGTTKPSEGNEKLSPTTEMMESPKAAQTLAPVPGTESSSPSVGSTLPSTTTAPQEAVATPSTPPTRTAVRLPELSQQLVPILRRVNTEGRQELRVRLDPPHLGELNVIVEDGLDGISVRIVAESRETLLLLQDQRTQLHDELSRQNLAVASFSASLAGDTSGQRSPSRFFAAPAPRSVQGVAVPEAESLSVVARIPLTIGGLDVHA